MPEDDKALRGEWKGPREVKRISARDLQKGERVWVEPETKAVSGEGEDSLGSPIVEMAHGEG